MDELRHLRLFEELPVPQWLPDETVYSLAARYHTLAGLSRASITSKVLFGSSRGGFPHALPSGLAHLADAFRTELGTSRQILSQHTIAPQLLVARLPSFRESAYEAMERGASGPLKAKLGLMASGFGGDLPLKACRTCLEMDEKNSGFGYWRVDHQLLGVWVCAQHNTLLEQSKAMRSGQARYDWLIPIHKDLVTPLEPDIKLSDSAVRQLSKLGDVSRWLMQLGQGEGIDLPRASGLMWKQLSETGLADSRRRLRQEKAVERFCRDCEPLRAVPELARLAATPSAAYSQLLAVLEGRAQGLHPLRFASVVAWLNEEVGEFAARYDDLDLDREIAEPELKAAPTKGVSEAKRIEFLRLFKTGTSITASARKVGIEVATGQAWAAAAGIDPPKRASIVRDELRGMLISKLRSGADKVEAARELNISESSVNRILRTEVGLHEAWKQARQEATKGSLRALWVRALGNLGHSVKVARAAEPAAYAWLYRNDRAWLSAQNGAHERKRSNNSSIDWDQRDRELSTAVLQAGEGISEGQGRIRLLDLLARVVSLKQKLASLEKLPLTERALETVMARKRRSRGQLFE